MSRGDDPLDWRALPVSDAGLSRRATNALRSVYLPADVFPPFQTIGEVAVRTDAELLRWPGIGPKVLSEARARIAALRPDGEGN